MLLGVMTPEEVQRTSEGENAEQFLTILTRENRATRLILASQCLDDHNILECGPDSSGSGSSVNGDSERRRSTDALQDPGATKTFWVAAEALPMGQPIYPNAHVEPELTVPHLVRGQTWERADAVREVVRGRTEVCGPITVG